MAPSRPDQTKEWDGAEVGAVADRMLAPVAIISADSTLRYVNHAAARAVGEDAQWLLGRKMLDFVHPDDRARVEAELESIVGGNPTGGFTTYRLRADPSADWRVFEAIADNLLDDPNIAGILVSSRDVTEQRAHERELWNAAYRDSLTGLPNRARIKEQLDAAMAEEQPFATVLLGIDRFNLVNDSLGHTIGDAVLQVVAARVGASVPATTVVGRFGGDLLVLLVSGPAAAAAKSLAWRACERVGEPLFIAGHELRLSLSAGIAHRDAAATTESLLRDASLALHRAKACGGGRVEVFESSMRHAAIARLEMEANLRQAVPRSELALALQPIVRLDDGVAERSEALVRWQREGRLVPPCEFIPIAEETGLIIPIGDWIIDRAAHLAEKAPGGQVMVNLSARQLASPGLVDRIARVLSARSVPSSAVGFEVTETLLIEQFDYTVSVLSAIRQLGCRVGLDDFGTGYSSLGYLRRLPIDFLKIDGSLIEDVDTDPQARAIVRAIITMGDALGHDVIAEGVEREAQADSLRGMDCVLAQGYYFARPAVPD